MSDEIADSITIDGKDYIIPFAVGLLTRTLTGEKQQLEKELQSSRDELVKYRELLGMTETLMNGWACPPDQGEQFDYDWINLDEALTKINAPSEVK